MIPDHRWVAGEAQDVAGTQGPRPEKVGGQAEAVPIPARQLQNRLDASRRHQSRSSGRGHVGRRCRVVGDVHRVRVADQASGLPGHQVRVARLRRHHLGGHAEHTLMKEALQPAL